MITKDFDESKHPRDEKGKFSEGGGASPSGKPPKPRGRALAVREGRVGARVRYPKRTRQMLEQLARGYQ